MKKLVLSLMVMVLAVTNINAQDDLSFTADVTYGSGFISNGIIWVDGSVAMPSFAVGYKLADDLSFSALYWAVINQNDVQGYDNPEDASGHVTEWDIFVDLVYTGSEDYVLGVGWAYYDFPNLDDDTTDVYASIGFSKVALSPKLTVLYDIDGANKGGHAKLDVSKTFTLEKDKPSFTVFGQIGWADTSYADAYFSDDGKSDQTLS
ncbi:MAG: hypothetical protein HRT89_20065, partial [Lentisphaeria bacterium]|nr:hypothetical protein [Lentisphaeria bacterium]NQZ70355.1 hypothetical protein [Lentisphaeria bacterium]